MALNTAIVAIVKNEGLYITEFLSYHMSIGVSHVFIYDNNSTDKLEEVLLPFINHGYATLIKWPKIGGQTDAYNHFLNFMGSNYDWVGFIDIDEFIVPNGFNHISDFLSGFDDEVSQVKLPWRNFQFSSHIARPVGWVTENFCFAQDLIEGSLPEISGKCFVRPQCVAKMYVHEAALKSGRSVYADGRDSAGKFMISLPNYNHCHLNHYYTKSVEEFQYKIGRGQSDGGAEKKAYGIEQSRTYNTLDTDILPYLPKAKEACRMMEKIPKNPHIYGKIFLPNFPHHELTEWDANRSLANELDDRSELSNISRQLRSMRSANVTIWDLGESKTLNFGDWVSSVHLKDFRRKCNISKNFLLYPDAGRFIFQEMTPDLHVPLAMIFGRVKDREITTTLESDHERRVASFADVEFRYFAMLVRLNTGYTDRIDCTISISGVDVDFSVGMLQD